MKKSIALILALVLAIALFFGFGRTTSASKMQAAPASVFSISSFNVFDYITSNAKFKSIKSSVKEKANERKIIRGVSLRSKASTKGKKIGTVKKGEVVTVISKPNSYWYKVRTKSGKVGYISSNYKYSVVYVPSKPVAKPTAKPTTKPVSPTPTIKPTQKPVLSVKPTEKPVETKKPIEVKPSPTPAAPTPEPVVEEPVVTPEPIKEPEVTPVVPVEQPEPVPTTKPVESWEAKADQIIEYGMKFLGVPYLLGGDYDEDGTMKFDCSGFINYIFERNGYKDIKRQSNAISKQGTFVAKKDIRKGDLVFSDTNKDGVINHVALYIGDNKLLHTFGAGGVKITAFEGMTWDKTYVTARRIIE